MTANLCAICGAPTDATVCHDDAQTLATALTTAAGHAEDAEAVLSRQARYGTGGRGGSDEPLPVDLTAARRLHAIANTVGGWARIVTAETGRGPRWRPLAGPLCPPRRQGGPCTHPSCDAIRRRTPPPALARELAWLSTQTRWLARHPAAAEAYRDLHAACDDLARLVDRPPDKVLFGVCDCGKVLYADAGKAYVTCPGPTCRLKWDVEQSRGILRQALDDKLVTAYEAARLGQYLDGDRTQDNIRKLIDSRVRSGQLLAHGHVETDDGDEPTYRFGDVALILATIPKRTRKAAA